MTINYAVTYPVIKTETSPHRHSQWEVVCFTEGEGVHHIEDEQLPVSAGTIIIQPPSKKHWTESANGFRAVYLGLNEYGQDPHYGLAYDDSGRRFATLGLMACEAFRNQEDQDFLDCLYRALLTLLLRYTHQETRISLTEKIKQQMSNHVGVPDFSPAAYIRSLGYSSDYIRRNFKRDTGMTPTAYYTRLKLEFSRKLLENKNTSGLRIGEIARISGFTDEYYYSKLFSQHYGMSPTNYLRSHLKE